MSITLPRFDITLMITLMKSGHIEGCAHLDKILFPEDCYSTKDFHRFIRSEAGRKTNPTYHVACCARDTAILFLSQLTNLTSNRSERT